MSIFSRAMGAIKGRFSRTKKAVASAITGIHEEDFVHRYKNKNGYSVAQGKRLAKKIKNVARHKSLSNG